MSDVQGAEADAGAENTGSVAQADTGDIHAKARRMGWRPREEFNGDPKRWVDADLFVAKVQDDVPFLKETLRTMDRKFSKLEQQLLEQTQVLTDFREFASRGEQRAYERALDELKAKREVAVASADTAAFHAAQSEIDKLNAETKPTTTVKRDTTPDTTRVPEIHPAMAAWYEKNQWFNNDTLLHNVAKGYDAQIMKDQPGIDLADRLERVTEMVKERFPEKFGGNTRREAPGAVLTPGANTATRRNAKSYDNLPADAKKACDKYVKTIPGFTREQYVKTYAWD